MTHGDDTSFNKHVNTFKNNIYGSSKGKIREAVLLRDLDPYINQKPLKILDVGGGQGQIARQLAKKGHHIVLTDISEEMLNEAKRQVTREGLDKYFRFVHAPLQELPKVMTERFDLVLCHAVFEWLAEPKAALNLLTKYLQANGLLSLMFYNKNGQVLSNLVYGNFDYIENGFKAKKVVKLNPQSALCPNEVRQWATDLNLETLCHSGVRCFHDYMRDTQHWQSQLEAIIKMELTYSTQQPFSEIGRYKHFIFKN